MKSFLQYLTEVENWDEQITSDENGNRYRVKDLYDYAKNKCEDCYNKIYEYIFILWNISNNNDTLYIFDNDELITIFLKVIKINKVDKIIRICMMIIKVKVFYI